MKVTGLDQISQSDKELTLDIDVLDALKDFIGCDPFCNYLTEFLQNTVKNLERIGIAIASEDEVRIRHLAHKLKASSGNIGAFKLAWNCVQLEAATIRGEAGDIEPNQNVNARFSELGNVFCDTRRALESYIDEIGRTKSNIA